VWRSRVQGGSGTRGAKKKVPLLLRESNKMVGRLQKWGKNGGGNGFKWELGRNTGYKERNWGRGVREEESGRGEGEQK